jgi:hypothetical protein
MKIGELKQLISDHQLSDDVEIVFQSTQEDFTIDGLLRDLESNDNDQDTILNSNIYMQDIYVHQIIKTGIKELLIVCDVKIEEVQ